MPDIDIDFPWDERDGVLEWVFEHFGVARTAMIANHNSFRTRAAVREIAKALGADHVIDYTIEGIGDGGRRFDVIIDIAGNRPLSELRRALDPLGIGRIQAVRFEGNTLVIRHIPA